MKQTYKLSTPFVGVKGCILLMALSFAMAFMPRTANAQGSYTSLAVWEAAVPSDFSSVSGSNYTLAMSNSTISNPITSLVIASGETLTIPSGGSQLWIADGGSLTGVGSIVSTSTSYPVNFLGGGTCSVNISGSGAVYKDGSGTLTLSGSNDINVLVVQGAVEITASYTIPASRTFTLNSGTTLAVNGVGSLSISGTLTNTGTLTNNATLTVNSGGQLNIGTNGATGSISGNIVNNGGLVRFHRGPGNPITYSGVISGTGTVQQWGAGAVTITSGLGSFTGETYLASIGDLNITGNVGGKLTVLSGAASVTGNVAGDLDVSGGTVDITGTVSGTTNFTGTGIVTINGFQVYPATVPDAPVIGTATAGNGQATVTFTAPANDGGAVITGYTVTASPGGFTATGAASPITVTGLANGTVYTFTVTATNSEGTSLPSAVSNSVTPAPATSPSPPGITGPTTMTLTTGYAATSTGVYTITGTAPVAVAKTSGDSHITWNAAMNYLDIAAGLTAGTYPVTLTASNGVTPNAQITFTLTVTAAIVTPTRYNIHIGSFTGGSICTDATGDTAAAGETVTLTINAATDYRFESISVYANGSGASIPLSGTGYSRTFTMPADDVTVTATFTKIGWVSAKAIIESAIFDIPQSQAGNVEQLCYTLAEIINRLIARTNFAVSSYDIVVYIFKPATAGDAANPSGVNGSFEFRVSPFGLNNSAYSDGVITATVFDTTGTEAIPPSGALKARTTDGLLHVSGLTAGKQWGVYNVLGTLIYQGIATGEQATIPLPVRAIYIVTSDNQTVKIAY